MCGDTRLELASTQFQPGTLELPHTHTHTRTQTETHTHTPTHTLSHLIHFIPGEKLVLGSSTA